MRSFFSKLRAVESCVIGEIEYSVEIQNQLQKLVSLIESGKLYRTEIGKFLCANFRKTQEQLLKNWNSTHEYEKNPNTLRCQISNTSKQLSAIFGVNFDKAYYEKKEEDISRISDLVDALWYGVDLDFEDLYISEVRDELLSSTVAKKYRAEECLEEIGVLKKLTRSNIHELLNDVDKNKLIFLRSVMIKPLIGSRAGDINYQKLELLRLLNGVNDTDIPLLENGFDYIDIVNPVVPMAPAYIPKKCDEYEVDSMDDLLKIFEEFSSKPSDNNNTQSSNAEKICRLLELYTAEGLKKYLSKYNSCDIHAALSSIKI